MSAAALHDRAMIIDRVAGAIWSAEPSPQKTTWAQAKGAPHLRRHVETARAQARAAISGLMIGADPKHEDVRLAMAGEHASGVVGGLCVEIFDAMLSEVLE